MEQTKTLVNNQQEDASAPPKGLAASVKLKAAKVRITWNKLFNDPKKKPLIIGVIAFIVVFLILLLVLIVITFVSRSSVELGEPVVQSTAQPGTNTQVTLKEKLDELGDEVHNFNIIERPLIPPEIDFDISF